MELLKLQLATRVVDAWYYRGASGKAPGILFLHDLTGLQKVNHKTAALLAKEGYHVLLPDLYTGVGRSKYCVRFLFDDLSRNNEPNSAPLNEILEMLDHFKSMNGVDAENLGLVGQCLTGGFVLHAAIRPEVKAPVVFHHSFGRKGSGIPPACSAMIGNKVQGHFVYLDPFCPPGRVKKLEEELGAQLEKYTYALPHGIPHLFFSTAQGQKAYSRMMQFFQSQLKPV